MSKKILMTDTVSNVEELIEVLGQYGKPHTIHLLDSADCVNEFDVSLIANSLSDNKFAHNIQITAKQDDNC